MPDWASRRKGLSLPDFGDRYGKVPILNAWSDAVGAPGCRQEKSTTMPFLLAGPSDHAAVHLLQDGTRVTPLSRWTGDPEEYTHPSDLSVAGGFDAVTARVSQVHRLSGRTYFARLDQLLVDNPPNPADAAFVERLSRLGVSPGPRLDDQPQGARRAGRRGRFGPQDAAGLQVAGGGGRRGLPWDGVPAHRIGPLVCPGTVDFSHAVFETALTLEAAAREVRYRQTQCRQILAEDHWRGWTPAPSGTGPHEPATLAPVYRQLRKALEDSRNGRSRLAPTPQHPAANGHCWGCTGVSCPDTACAPCVPRPGWSWR
ncbi:DUF1254 domain-containing protein [Streptomyces sp. NPDC021139]|uniref:DUF1254 domain-containing protein n=1 Tax=unclassified Streptomyces TaxID=2593676 RepID=UPI000B23C3E1